MQSFVRINDLSVLARHVITVITGGGSSENLSGSSAVFCALYADRQVAIGVFSCFDFSVWDRKTTSWGFNIDGFTISELYSQCFNERIVRRVRRFVLCRSERRTGMRRLCYGVCETLD